jgi:hypothetical protein
MRHQHPLQPDAIGQASTQGVIRSFEPAGKGPTMASFPCEEQADRDQLTWIQCGLLLPGYLLHVVVDRTKDLDENVFGSQKASSFQEWFGFSLEHDLCGLLNEHHWLLKPVYTQADEELTDPTYYFVRFSKALWLKSFHKRIVFL